MDFSLITINMRESLDLRKASNGQLEQFHRGLNELFCSKLHDNDISEIDFDDTKFTYEAEKLLKLTDYTYKNVVRKKRPYDELRVVLNLSDVMEFQAAEPEENLQSEAAPAAAHKKYRRSLDVLGDKQHWRRLNDVCSQIKSDANENGVSTLVYMAHVIKQITYMTPDRAIGSEVADLLVNGLGKHTLSLDASSHLQQRCRHGRTAYQDSTRIVLKQNTPAVIPTWKLLRSHQLSITPMLLETLNPVGIKCHYREALELTVKRILQLIPVPNLPTSNNLIFTFKDGVDGSGGHPIYNQLKNEDTHSIIIYMFACLMALEEGCTIPFWVEEAPNSPFAQRVLFLTLGKETKENLLHIKDVKSERTLDEPMTTEVNGRSFNVSIVCKMTAIDGKMRALLSGRGGSWCLLCGITRSQAAGTSTEDFDLLINCEWGISHTYEETQRIWDEQSVIDESGNAVMPRKAGDRDVRKGVTGEPIISEDLNFVSPLHVYLRTWDFVFKLIVRLRVPFYNWADSSYSSMKPMIEKERQDCIDEINALTGDKVDVPDPTGHGGTSTTGPVVRNLFGPEVHVPIGLVPENHKETFSRFIITLDVLLGAYSSTREIDVDAYKNLIKEVYIKLLVNLRGPNNKPWIYPSPTVHSFLGHSLELLQVNDNHGLGKFSEQGLENNNKILRFFRKNLSRKCSQYANLSDCFSRLWLQSDPVIRRCGRQVKPCTHCSHTGHFTVSCPEKLRWLDPVQAPDSWRQTLLRELYV